MQTLTDPTFEGLGKTVQEGERQPGPKRPGGFTGRWAHCSSIVAPAFSVRHVQHIAGCRKPEKGHVERKTRAAGPGACCHVRRLGYVSPGTATGSMTARGVSRTPTGSLPTRNAPLNGKCGHPNNLGETPGSFVQAPCVWDKAWSSDDTQQRALTSHGLRSAHAL